MTTKKLKIAFTTLLTILSLSLSAQNDFSNNTGNQIPPEQVEMADTLRADGKIYVVVGVVTIIVVGLFMYLINIDRKISKLEKEVNK